MRATFGERARAVLLAMTLAGCAARPAPPTNLPRAAATESAATPPTADAVTPPPDAPLATDAADEGGLSALIAARLALASHDGDDEDGGFSFSPEAIHRARIAMAREALVEDNAMKQRIDVEEQLQRELEELSDRPAKSHVPPRRGRARVDHAGAPVGSPASQRSTVTP